MTAFPPAARLALALVALARLAAAQCSGGAACPPCSQCRIAPASGTNPTVPEMATLFDRVAAGPTRYGNLGWDFGGATSVNAGPGWCGGAGRKESVAVSFPCVLLKAIYVTESNWRQFCTTNQTVISFDCGYGIAQVTSGMRPGETSRYDANRVASSPAYNVSVGAAILADKWRIAPCVGPNDPEVIEHWYFAVWGYNGFAFKNNPNNPMYAAARPEFRTPGVASAQTRGNYPYQELVWGYVHYPPSAAHYRGIALAYPNRAEICSSCGRPTTSVSEPPGTHRGGCETTPATTDGGVSFDASLPTDSGLPSRDAEPPPVALDASARDASVVDEAGNDASASASGDVGGCTCHLSPPTRRDGDGLLASFVALGVWLRRREREPRKREA